ncbi:MAG: acetyl-CoA acetyltransferase [Deltaproteobacteria bacterium RIFCSPLOWO2_12_FULL_44_12]|nr:MAG: acetyl-CoA acetyltransferase [Deltaproteobacteria bacterium RIFCSPHIGHO2_01_FULL_43_49]OGQ15476.1 MAG: acetyl-CoA acetyltransferase [Deltaproteobacteria bacterium RIFCSPHIGHO2_02_FULL_44_53]OGQ29669.1 MAG: acetyl-CoA acetyltransferase [Deltaproteobacteria bacterium RIFCSPHIGHO2_12_FULL_44_21]OGQ32282.1 MAG: acetyl-CoA acetyltransferase [Deltaproteobacteria bacterium RIFCSPLOWO2_01_FULL_45_74]OGQ43924.1 MAG: acetyl-CoA acetyltransferase [Deltaproteobacteria bacterium RIFCSPLOWO2_02_FULL_
MRPVYVVSGGVSKFTKARHDKTFQAVVKEAFEYAVADLNIDTTKFLELVDGSVASYFSDHFQRQLMSGIMAQDYLGLCPKPSHRVEGGGATGGLAFQEGWKSIASGHMDVCAVYGFETMSHVETWKGNEFIALASDVSFDFPVGGFYSGYYAMMVVRHMQEFGTTVEQMAHVSVKNHRNAYHNPYAQKRQKLTIEDVRNSTMVAWPLTRLDICVMSDGAAAVILASEEGVKRLEKAAGRTLPKIKVTGIGRGTDAMRMSDRPHKKVPLLSFEKESDYKNLKYPGIHSFRAGRSAAIQAYKHAGIKNPIAELDFVELHDAYTSSEIQTYEDLGLCRYGQGGELAVSGKTFMPGVDYGLKLKEKPICPVNPSGGLIACGHPVGATGLMQAVFALWQLQNTIGKHFKDPALQIKNAKKGLIHSHAGTGTYVTVSILEA